MSQEQPTTTSLREYYKRFVGRFRRELRKAVWEAMIAIIAIIVVIFFQFYFGWIKREETLSSALINIAPAAAILLAYGLRHLIRTPWLLDVARQGEINESNEALTKLQTSLNDLTSELTRPKFAITKASVGSYSQTFDEDDRHRLNFVVENIGSHAADEMVWRVVVVDEDPGDTNPKCQDSSMTNEIPINQPFDMEFGFSAASPKPIIIVFCLKYKDAITKSQHRQTFFHKWVRLQFGAEEVRHLTIEEREAAQARLTEQLSGFV